VNGRLEDGLKEMRKRGESTYQYIASEGVELVPRCLLTIHFLTLQGRIKSAVPPFVGGVGIVVIEAEAIVASAEGIAEG